MTRRKFFVQAAILFFAAFFCAITAHAQIQTCTGTGEYLMVDETIAEAKKQAKLSAERAALEQICVYVQSRSESKDFELKIDEIITIAVGILRIVDTKFSMTDESNGTLIKAVVTAEIDVDELNALLERETKNLKE